MDPEKTNMEEDEFMASARLEPDKISFPGKDKLRKSAADLTDTQIEYLSIACLEKDISPDQLQELEINLKENRESRAIFDVIQQTKLVAPAITYKQRSSLKKLTAGQKAFRIMTAGLSAAAVISILIVSYIFVPDIVKSRNNQIAAGIIPDSIPVTILIESKSPIIALAALPVSKKGNDHNETVENILLAVIPDTLQGPRTTENQSMPFVSVPAVSGIRVQSPDLFLIASNNSFTAAAPDDERSRLRKFIASTFREKLLGEEKYKDSPLKPFEIALASIDGLNKLLDWNMELKETLNEAGEVKSVYFSSALLTFNSPVRKTSE